MSNKIKCQEEETVKVWENVSQYYDLKKYWDLPENHANLEHLLNYIGSLSGKRIIEVGSGSGFTSLALAKKGALCAFLDVSAASLKIVKDNFINMGLQVPECYNEDALSNHIPSNSFDIVWNGGVIEHFYDDGKKKLILEMLRIAKPGGKVIILVPNALCIQFQIIQAWQKFRKTWQYGFEDDMSPKRILNMCKQFNLNIIDCYAFNPILGWRQYPIVNRLLKICGYETIKHHSKRSRIGFVTIIAIQKC